MNISLRYFLRLIMVVLALALSSNASLAMLEDSAFQTSPVMRDETRDLVKYLERVHYAGIPIQNIDATEFLKSYMSDLDYQRLFFIDADLKDFEIRFKGMMDVYLRQGTIMPAFEIFKLYRSRSLSRMDWVFKRLGSDFDFKLDDAYAPDRSKADWPATEKEADVLWEKRLKYELIIEMLDPGKVGTDDSDDLESSVEKSIEKKPTKKDVGKGASVEKDKSTAKEAEAEKPLITKEQALANLDAAKEKVKKRYEQMQRNVTQIEPIEVQEMFLTALTHMYDPHSTFLSADSLEDFAIAIKNSLVGIGAMLSLEDGYCVIKELIPGGPADVSSLLTPTDKIVAVAQAEGKMEDVVGMKLRKIVKLIRGNEGTKVRLLIQPGGADPSERKEIILVRDKIKITASLAQAEIFQVPSGNQTCPIGVIELPAFYGSGEGSANSTTNDVAELIGKLKKSGVKGLILDLRNNGGGLLSEAVGLAGLFIPTGPVVQVKNTIGHIDEHSDTDPNIAWSGPLVVLVSRFSASASEIVTGALKNHRRALVVGDSATHGKGTVQAVFEMDRLGNTGFFNARKARSGAAKVTIQKWYLPNGESTQIKGVPSDIWFSSERDFLPIGEGDLPRALIWDSIDPLASFNPKAFDNNFEVGQNLVSPNLVSDLNNLSLGRRSQLDEFSYWKSRVGWFEERYKQKSISLNLEKRIEKRKEDKASQKLFKDKEALFAKSTFQSNKVLLNITMEKEQESRNAHKNEGEDAKINPKKNGFDIQLRESLRIMVDWLNMKPSDPAVQIAKQKK